MIDLECLERRHLQVTLHREHLSHAVGDGRARREDHTAAAVHPLDVTDLQEHVEGALRRGLRQSGGCYPEFLKRQYVVLPIVCGQFFELGFEPFLFPLQHFHRSRAVLLSLLFNRQCQFTQLSFEKLLLGRARHGNLLETGVGNDDRIPVPSGDAAHQRFALLLLKIVLSRNENVRARIQRE